MRPRCYVSVVYMTARGQSNQEILAFSGLMVNILVVCVVFLPLCDVFISLFI